MSITMYCGHLMKLWNELADFKKVSSCSCGKSDCNLDSGLKNYEIYQNLWEISKFYRFLMGLNTNDYGMIHSQLLSNYPIPNLHNAYQILTHEEKVRGITCNTEI